MRGRLFHPVTFIVFVLFSLGANLSAATSVHSTAAPWTVVNQPARVVNGMPVLFRVTTPRPVRALSGNWLGHEIAFSLDATPKSWFPLAGPSLQTNPAANHGSRLLGPVVKPNREPMPSSCVPKHLVDK